MSKKLALALATLLCAFAFFRLIHLDSVDVLYYDEWDYLAPLFRGESLWHLFGVQHGPVRLGLGGVVLGMIIELTAWSTRAVSFGVGIITALAFGAALLVKRRLGDPLSFGDLLLPFIFFNLAQLESLVVVANPGYGAVPLLLAMLYVAAWTLRGTAARYAAIVVLNFLLIFTGFGIFFGAITPALLAIDVYRRRRWEPAAALVAALLSVGVFLIGWHFEPSIACFEFPHRRPLQYVWFVALMFARFIGAQSIAIGTVLLIALLVIVVMHVRKLVRDFDPRSIAVVTLGSWTLIFCANAAIGRVCAGIAGGLMSRYATLMIPGFVSMYLSLPKRKYVQIALAILLVTLPLRDWNREFTIAGQYADGKRAWSTCHRSAHAITPCDIATRFSVYPTPTIDAKLQFLEKRRLNLFR